MVIHIIGYKLDVVVTVAQQGAQYKLIILSGEVFPTREPIKLHSFGFHTVVDPIDLRSQTLC